MRCPCSEEAQASHMERLGEREIHGLPPSVPANPVLVIGLEEEAILNTPDLADVIWRRIKKCSSHPEMRLQTCGLSFAV